MKEILIGAGFGMFLGALAMAFILKDLIRPDTKIHKIVNRGRGNDNDIAVEVKQENKRRKLFRNKKKS